MVWGDEADRGVTPRGRVHPAYRGGPTLVPVLAPHQRLDPETQHLVAKVLKAAYERGMSIRELAVETGYTIQRVRTLLTAAGTTFRERGKRYSG
jgi:FAD/FMN-containing dehydrogenase